MTKQSNGNKTKKKNVPNATFVKSKAPKRNPFETIWLGRKSYFLSKKRKGEEKRIGTTRSLAFRKRKRTLLKENEQRGKSYRMEEQKWEDLNLDCLLNVFERLGLGSLVLDIPFVCKSWYKATLYPQCWHHIELPTDRLQEPGVLGIIKFAIKRNARYVVSVKTPHNYNPARKSCNSTKDLLAYVANECPFLKGFLMSPCLSPDQMRIVPGLVSKWTNLEWLTLQYSSYMQEIFTQVSLHCKKLVGLAIRHAYFCDKEASDIATLLPNIKYLYLSYAYLHEDDLGIILRGCKELLYLDVRYCVGFEEDDNEILKLASHIPTFMCEGSREAIGGWWSRKRVIYPPIDG